VVGATGVVGRGICAELVRRGAAVAGVGHRGAQLAELARELPIASSHTADAFDAPALARAFAGAVVVVNAAGPLRDTAAPVLTAALAAGAHYVDVGGEQAVLRAVYEGYESAARHAGLVALPGAGLDCVIGDLAAAWAARHLIGGEDPGAAVRHAPAARLAEDSPLDDIAVSYVFDDLALSIGSQRALFAALGTRAVVWRRDRWDDSRAGDHRRIDAGPVLGVRDALGYAGGDAITIPRHVAAQLVSDYVSTTRSPGATAALRLALRALRFVPRAAAGLLVPYATAAAAYEATALAVVATVRRGGARAQIVVRGHDLYRTTSAITAWVAHRLAERGAGPTGMCAPGELFRAEPALRELAIAADLVIEPSFA
jgi:saccharopine dehydrogenase-like NADP-dependent oxidoreductase